MGIYQSEMIFPLPAPFALPKFGILVKYYESIDSLADDLLLKVYIPGDQKDAPTITMPIPRSPIGPPPDDLEEDQERIFAATVPIMFAPLMFAKEGFIRVRMFRGDIITKLGSLKIRQIRPDEKIPGFNA